MALFSIENVALKGISACLPLNEESNFQYALITPRERELLVKTTGIASRRIALPGLCASDMCVEAAKALMKSLNWAPEEVQALILVTQTPDFQIPASSMQIQDRLGLPKSCLAFDINQGCAGYVYGLATMAALLGASGLKKGLLLVGDTITRTINPKDKTSAPIFSDAGTATALVFEQGVPPIHFNLQSDGSGFEAISIPEGGARTPGGGAGGDEIFQNESTFRLPNQLSMKGLEVFNFALREVVPNIEELLKTKEVSKQSIDYFVFHQANLLMNEALRKKMKIAPEKVPYSIGKYGNTSCATIPLTLVTELAEQLSSGQQRLLLSGFGVGLSWGSAILTTHNLKIPGLIEV